MTESTEHRPTRQRRVEATSETERRPVAVVTGGSQGLGEVVVRALARSRSKSI